MSAVEGADLGPADEPYDPEWVRALIDDRARLQVEVETLQRQADMYRALARKRDTAFAERLTQRVTEDKPLLDRIEAGPAVEGADTTAAQWHEATGIPLYEETEIRAVFEKLKWHNVDLFLSVLQNRP